MKCVCGKNCAICGNCKHFGSFESKLDNICKLKTEQIQVDVVVSPNTDASGCKYFEAIAEVEKHD